MTVLSAASAAAFLPTSYGDVSAWQQGEQGDKDQAYPYVDIEITCGATACSLTAARLYAMVLDTVAVAAATFTTTHGTEVINSTAHGLLTGDGPIRFTNSGGALPAGYAVDTDYYVIEGADANKFKVSLTRAGAFAGTIVAISGDGTGTHTYTGYTTGNSVCQRPTFMSLGLLGDGGDGAITLTQRQGYAQRYAHSPRFSAYALSGTLSAGTITVKVRNVWERE